MRCFTIFKFNILLTLLCFSLGSIADTHVKNATSLKGEGEQASAPPVVVTHKVLFETSMGNVLVGLYGEDAPISVENFLRYVNDGFYDGTIFHRVMDGFMIQGGGFDINYQKKETHDPIKNEAENGLKNLVGTLAMARTQVINSATSQFFVNVVDNSFLDYTSSTARGYGYAVFGRVLEGMDVVEKIKVVPIQPRGRHPNAPAVAVQIISSAVQE